MSLLGHGDVIFIQVRWYYGLFLPNSFFLLFRKNIKCPFLIKETILDIQKCEKWVKRMRICTDF